MQNAAASRAAACNVQIRRNAERAALAAELIPVLEIGRVRDFGRISHGHGGRRLHRVHIRHGREGCVGIERAVRRFGRIFGVRAVPLRKFARFNSVYYVVQRIVLRPNLLDQLNSGHGGAGHEADADQFGKKAHDIPPWGVVKPSADAFYTL